MNLKLNSHHQSVANQWFSKQILQRGSRIILCMRPANERRRYKVTSSLYWLDAHTKWSLGFWRTVKLMYAYESHITWNNTSHHITSLQSQWASHTSPVAAQVIHMSSVCDTVFMGWGIRNPRSPDCCRQQCMSHNSRCHISHTGRATYNGRCFLNWSSALVGNMKKSTRWAVPLLSL